MARMLRSAAGMTRAIRGGAPSNRALPVEPEIDMLMETLKDRGVCSVKKEFVHQSARSIDLALMDKMDSKVIQAGLMAALIISGMTFGNTLVSESPKERKKAVEA